MRSYPSDESENEEAKELNAETWQLDLLKLNPSYVYWGPHEDYMCRPGENEEPDPDEDLDSPAARLFAPKRSGHGWETRMLYKTWKEHNVTLDELNEVVNFYFSVGRDTRRCRNCRGTGYHPDALWVERSWYRHSNPFTQGVFPSKETLAKYGENFRAFCGEMRTARDGWHCNITQDEVDALVEAGRLYDFVREVVPDKGWVEKNPPVRPTADQVNRWARREKAPDLPFGGLGHDAINMHVCVKQRCARFGIPLTCPECKGSGRIFTAPKAHVTLTYWLLHPRKGCSRGVEVALIERQDLPEVFKFLREAAARNAERFAGVAMADSEKFVAVKS
jgi:hypothetical protein